MHSAARRYWAVASWEKRNLGREMRPPAAEYPCEVCPWPAGCAQIEQLAFSLLTPQSNILSGFILWPTSQIIGSLVTVWHCFTQQLLYLWKRVVCWGLCGKTHGFHTHIALNSWKSISLGMFLNSVPQFSVGTPSGFIALMACTRYLDAAWTSFCASSSTSPTKTFHPGYCDNHFYSDVHINNIGFMQRLSLCNTMVNDFMHWGTTRLWENIIIQGRRIVIYGNAC